MLISNLLATKLYAPPHPAKWVQRPFLNRRLHEGLLLKRPITLVSAPAGFGKTTCITAWISSIDTPVSWLSLDPGDDDPGRFLTYFVAALQKVNSKLGREIEGAIRVGQLPPVEIIGTTLINEILQLENRFLLVLDDLQVIQDPFILRVLHQLLANCPPQLHLVLITREDPPLPLARLRANNQLTEIRARDLRFSGQDTGYFLNDVLGLALAESDIVSLENKTEGWAVGLQLAAIALQSSPGGKGGAGPSAFIASLSGSQRFILSYLTEQVLDQQQPEIRQFLLESAVLDKLHGDLCSAVSGRPNGRAMLERLYEANLFLIPLDEEGHWYRFHHLFADLLRDRQGVLLGEKTAEFHQRAAHWYSQREMAAEAIHHALAAEDYSLAVDQLEIHALRLVMQGYVKAVNRWVQAIPQQWQSQSPKTHLALAWMYFLRGAYSQAAPHLEILRATLAGETSAAHLSAEDASLRSAWLVTQSLLLYMQGQPQESKMLAERALEIAPEQDTRVRSLAYYALASVCSQLEDYAQATAAYRLAIQLGRAAENHFAEIMSTIGLAMMAFEHGQLHLAFETAASFAEGGENSMALPPISAGVFGVLGEVCLQWFQLPQARSHIQRSLHLFELGGYNTGAIFGHVTLSRLAQIEGDLDTAARECQTAVNRLPLEMPQYIRHEVAAQQVNLNLAHNHPAAAEMVLQGLGFSFQDRFVFPDIPSTQGLSHTLGLVYNSSLRYLLYQARNGRDFHKLRTGIELANRLYTTALEGRQVPVALETLLLRAQIHAVLGNDQAGRSDYISALELAEPEGFIGIFVEQGAFVAQDLAQLARHNQSLTLPTAAIKRILAAFDHLQTLEIVRQAPSLIEPISERELEVLHLMAEGLKYKEIAARLFISLNTVRYHVKGIYGKLNVNNRTQAIQTARRLNIL